MSFPSGLTVIVAFAPGSLLVQVTTALTVFGQSLSGNFSFQQDDRRRARRADEHVR